MKRIAMLICLAALGACKQAADEPAADRGAARPAPAQPAPAAPKPATPEPATPSDAASERPALQVQTIEGEAWDLAAHRGKWVVVNFWATWCSPCLEEMPELSALDAMREHVEVVGLAYEEIEPLAMQAFLRKHPVVYPVAIVDVYDPPKDFPTPRGLPMTWLIAPDGKVAKRFLGPVTAKEVEAAIAAAGGPKTAA